MQIVNRTDHPVRHLRQLVDFVARRSKFCMMARLVVEQMPSGMGVGYSWKLDPRPGDHLLVTPSLVRVSLAGHTYPYVTQTVPEVPGQRLADWREEFVLILAHELAHIDQFWTGRSATVHEDEVLAEREAVKVLDEYRKFPIGNKKARKAA